LMKGLRGERNTAAYIGGTLPKPPLQSHLFASDLSRDLIPCPASGS
jgi:hypothetical protein